MKGLSRAASSRSRRGLHPQRFHGKKYSCMYAATAGGSPGASTARGASGRSPSGTRTTQGPARRRSPRPRSPITGVIVDTNPVAVFACPIDVRGGTVS